MADHPKRPLQVGPYANNDPRIVRLSPEDIGPLAHSGQGGNEWAQKRRRAIDKAVEDEVNGPKKDNQSTDKSNGY